MDRIEIFCFFENIGEYMDAHKEDLFNVECSFRAEFILETLPPLRCGSHMLSTKEGAPLFCFMLVVSISYMEENPPKLVEELVEKIERLPLFTDPAIRNFVCRGKNLEPQVIQRFKEEGVFFKGSLSLVHYAMRHGLIEYDALSQKHRDDIDEIMEMVGIEKKPTQHNIL